MNLAPALTSLALGDATSRNLEFSHGDDVWVSYGEETITETNLLEIRRRHPAHVRVRTFPKKVEATNGADWEWHIVGSLRTLRMRVQAKRLQRNGVLKVRHTVKSSGKEQRDLLIAGAGAEGMKPVYCIYCTEPQRTFWNEVQAVPGCCIPRYFVADFSDCFVPVDARFVTLLRHRRRAGRGRFARGGARRDDSDRGDHRV